MEKLVRHISKIIVHVTDSPDSLDIGVKEVRSWHTDPPPKGNGWSDIGYHFLVKRDGVMEIGRPVEKAGAHCKGHNSNSVAICWVGRAKPTTVQYQSLLNTTRLLMQVYGISKADVYGHRELAPGKDCPALDMDKFRREL